ncbi:MAG TPA: hypothetical protein PLY87_23335 [Planctomycetaceae bacterium]|nr:hypothetical protein [Planctomycetaceae bacterium]
MPLHDWTRVLAGTFHDFHYIWVAELRHRLNRGLLSEGFYAQAEQVAGGSLPDMPLFLDPDWYVNVPLEETYLKAWEEFPDRWKKVVMGRE